MPDDLDWLLFTQEGVLTWRQACRYLTPDVVRTRVTGGRWQRPCRGVVVSHSGPLSTEQREWAAVLAAGRGAHLAGPTAARVSGLRGYESHAIHLLLPANRIVDRAGVYFRNLPVVLHRTKVLAAADTLARPPRTTIARSLVDAAQWAPSDDVARAVIAAGFQQRLVGLDEMTATLHRMPRARRRRLVLEIAVDAAGGAHSLAEIDFFRLCRRHGLPPPTRQERRRDANGKSRWLDAYWQQWRVHVEVDGSHHTEVSQWWDDMRRQNNMWLTGDRVLRFPACAIRRDEATVAQQLRTALASAGWTPYPPVPLPGPAPPSRPPYPGRS